MKRLFVNTSILVMSLFFSMLTIASSLLSVEKTWSLEGFNEPESVLAHPREPLLFVSNINGKPMELNGKGYISLVSASGHMIKQKWVEGMNAPKGMAFNAGYLYVADMQTLHIIDYQAAKLVRSITVNSSVMLNDISVDNKGVVYISDMLGGGIYRYQQNKIDQWISAETLPHPNGLFIRDNQLIVATWGEGLNDDFSTTALGGLYQIDLTDKHLEPYQTAQQFGNLDGVAFVQDTLIVNDWINGNVFQYRENTLEKLFNAGKNAADISALGNTLYIPMMFNKRIDSYHLH